MYILTRRDERAIRTRWDDMPKRLSLRELNENVCDRDQSRDRIVDDTEIGQV
jgi:hypothetical protein